MKKYISLLSIAVAFLMQSCERSDSNYDMEGQTIQKSNKNNRDNSVKELPCIGQTESNNFEPGGDDEPDRDKQHWRSTRNGHK